MLPSGWMSSNHAFVIEGNLALCGDGGEENWRSGTAGINQVMSEMVSSWAIWKSGDFSIPNPRRIVAVAMLPAISNLWKKAGENLFHRRCAILTCALHRHRLAHERFPGKLAELDAAFLAEPMKDPAKAGALLNYRKTERGFLLWSVGEDRNDDGGGVGKDWIWRHEKGI